eukprot:GHVP01060838.1.p1 GENE.GHVP01060838.1~~GHVP01060838.1.p1  ORF type:complete len:584 (-),score=117.78 GHVP01060838.1:714-2465(-)
MCTYVLNSTRKPISSESEEKEYSISAYLSWKSKTSEWTERMEQLRKRVTRGQRSMLKQVDNLKTRKQEVLFSILRQILLERMFIQWIEENLDIIKLSTSRGDFLYYKKSCAMLCEVLFQEDNCLDVEKQLSSLPSWILKLVEVEGNLTLVERKSIQENEDTGARTENKAKEEEEKEEEEKEEEEKEEKEKEEKEKEIGSLSEPSSDLISDGKILPEKKEMYNLMHIHTPLSFVHEMWKLLSSFGFEGSMELLFGSSSEERIPVLRAIVDLSSGCSSLEQFVRFLIEADLGDVIRNIEIEDRQWLSSCKFIYSLIVIVCDVSLSHSGPDNFFVNLLEPHITAVENSIRNLEETSLNKGMIEKLVQEEMTSLGRRISAYQPNQLPYSILEILYICQDTILKLEPEFPRYVYRPFGKNNSDISFCTQIFFSIVAPNFLRLGQKNERRKIIVEEFSRQCVSRAEAIWSARTPEEYPSATVVNVPELCVGKWISDRVLPLRRKTGPWLSSGSDPTSRSQALFLTGNESTKHEDTSSSYHYTSQMAVYYLSKVIISRHQKGMWVNKNKPLSQYLLEFSIKITRQNLLFS